MSYQKYDPPSVAGITWASGPGTLQPLPEGYLASEADARLIFDDVEKAIGKGNAGELVNAAVTPWLNMRFRGLDPASPYQPWWVTGTDTFPRGPVGPAVGLRYVNGVGAPGHWEGIGTGNTRWVPDPAPAPAPPPQPTGGEAGGAWPAASDASAMVKMQHEVSEILKIVKGLAK